MEEWTAQHCAFVVEAYFKNGDSAKEISRKCFCLKKKPRGRILTVRTPENVDKVRMAIVKSPRRSVRRHSAAIGLSERSLRRIVDKELNFHPYKIAIVQELNDRDMANRRISSEQLLEILNDDGVINSLLMTDEAHFHLSGYVNKQNYRYWAPENILKIQNVISLVTDKYKSL